MTPGTLRFLQGRGGGVGRPRLCKSSSTLAPCSSDLIAHRSLKICVIFFKYRRTVSGGGGAVIQLVGTSRPINDELKPVYNPVSLGPTYVTAQGCLKAKLWPHLESNISGGFLTSVWTSSLNFQGQNLRKSDHKYPETFPSYKDVCG